MTEYEMLKHIHAVRVTKSGKADKRYKLTRELEAKYSGGLHIVNQSKRKGVQAIAEAPKRKRVQKIKKTSLREKVSGFFRVLFIFSLAIAIPLSYAIAER